MKGIRIEIKHIMRAVTVLAAIFTMTFVLAGSANAVVIGPLGNPAFVRPPIGFPAIARPPIASPFFRPPVFNPFLGADLDDLGLGLGVGIGEAD